MYSTDILLFCRFTVAFTFLWAFIGKIRHRASVEEAIVNFDVLPAVWRIVATWMVLSVELAIICLLSLPGVTLFTGFLLAIIMLILFSLLLGKALLSNMAIRCNCFGLAERAISVLDVVRNAVLIALSATGLGLFTISSASGTWMEYVIIMWISVCYTVVLIHLSAIVQTLRRPFYA